MDQPGILNKTTWNRLYGKKHTIHTETSLFGWSGAKELQHCLASYLGFPFSEADREILESGGWLPDDEQDDDEETSSPAHQRRRIGSPSSGESC